MAFPHSWGFPEVAQFSAFLGSFLKFVEKAYRMVFASMRAVRLFLRARSCSYQFCLASSEHLRNYKWRAASYGCGDMFAEKFRQPPYNIVVKHVDRRVVRRDDNTGALVYSTDFTNTYYHPSPAHIR